jgi:nucleoside-diphosphate-sugar epimerase
MRIFVTGNRGYIGAHLVQLLKEEGHEVTACDLGLYEGCEWETITAPDHQLNIDIRLLKSSDLAGHDCVMHLAAISNDPMADLDPMITEKVNLKGSVHLARIAKEAGVPRFLFAGSCSIYGKGEHLDLDENAPLHPLTAYAKSKIDFEKELFQMADDEFSPAVLRNSTAYGASPMLRIDLVVNNLLACAFSRGDIRIHSDGSPWRPLIHCRDIARAFIAFAKAPREVIHGRAINVGGNSENYQVKDVGDQVQKLLPNADVVFTGEVGNDPRNYRVKFDLLNTLLPEFQLQYNLESGMLDLFEKFSEYGFSEADFNGEQFVRLRTLRHRLGRLQLAEPALI